MTTATVANMQRFEAQHPHFSCFAFSPFTGEEVSATPGDYFWLGAEPLTDEMGEPMVLAVRSVQYLDALTREAV